MEVVVVGAEVGLFEGDAVISEHQSILQAPLKLLEPGSVPQISERGAVEDDLPRVGLTALAVVRPAPFPRGALIGAQCIREVRIRVRI